MQSYNENPWVIRKKNVLTHLISLVQFSTGAKSLGRLSSKSELLYPLLIISYCHYIAFLADISVMALAHPLK